MFVAPMGLGIVRVPFGGAVGRATEQVIAATMITANTGISLVHGAAGEESIEYLRVYRPVDEPHRIEFPAICTERTDRAADCNKQSIRRSSLQRLCLPTNRPR